MNHTYLARPWMKYVLKAAGIYNLVWGLLAIAIPVAMLDSLHVEADSVAVRFWQCIGMIVGVYGIGYLVASRDPFRHWPITLVGLLGKIFGPIGLVWAVADRTLPATLGWMTVTNDLIWLVPFFMILWGALRYSQAIGSAYEETEADDPLRELMTNTGERLDELADSQPQLVVFLRHAGCTFCRESLDELSKQRSQIESTGCGIVLVHLGHDDGEDFFAKYNMQDVPRIQDPNCRLYRQFGLGLGDFTELFGLRVWIRGVIAGLIYGHGRGPIMGNSFQMPGIYLYHSGQVLGGYQHESASDRPSYLALARQAPQLTPQNTSADLQA